MDASMQVFEIEPLKRRALALLRDDERSPAELARALAVPGYVVDVVLEALAAERLAEPCGLDWELTTRGWEFMAGVPQ